MGQLISVFQLLLVFIIVGVLLLVLNLISVHQLFSIVPALICEITVTTVKTFDETRLSSFFGEFYKICTAINELSHQINRFQNQFYYVHEYKFKKYIILLNIQRMENNDIECMNGTQVHNVD